MSKYIKCWCDLDKVQSKYWLKYDIDYYESEGNHNEDYIDVLDLGDYNYFNYE